jgi:hypothetical protein
MVRHRAVDPALCVPERDASEPPGTVLWTLRLALPDVPGRVVYNDA